MFRPSSIKPSHPNSKKKKKKKKEMTTDGLKLAASSSTFSITNSFLTAITFRDEARAVEPSSLLSTGGVTVVTVLTCSVYTIQHFKFMSCTDYSKSLKSPLECGVLFHSIRGGG